MKANVTQIETFIDCPTRWFAEYVVQRGPDKTSPALKQGTAWHEACEFDSLAPILAIEDKTVRQVLLLAWRRKRAAMREWEIETVANEVSLSRDLGPHTLFGRIDSVVRWNGSYWGLQWKTLAGSADVPFFGRLIARSYHEQVYKYIAEPTYSPWGGTILGVVQKKSRIAVMAETTKTRGKFGRGEQPFTILPIAITHSERALVDIQTHLDAMEKTAAPQEFGEFIITPESIMDNGMIEQNPKACGGWFHSPGTACPFLNVCDGLASISAMPEKDPLAHYKPKEVPSG